MSIWKNSNNGTGSNLTPATSGTVLLVDDEPLVRAMTSAVLTATGWNVINVSSGEDAVHMLRHLKERDADIDLVILDLILPFGMCGLDTVRHLREIAPDIRILACSGFFEDGAGDSYARMGFNAMLAKPFTAEELSQAVFHCMHTSGDAPLNQISRA